MGSSLLLQSCAKGDDLQSGRFRDEVVAVLRAQHPDWPVALDPADPQGFRVGELAIYVGNLYIVVDRLETDRRRDEIIKFLDVVAQHRQKGETADKAANDETFEQARTRLRVQLVPTGYFVKGTDVVHRTFSDELAVVYALDEPNSYGVLTNKTLGRWGVAASTVETVAIANLEEASRAVEPEIKTGRGGGFVTSSTGDSYDSARLLLPGFMERVRRSLGPNLVMAVPRRDFLIGWTPDYGGRRDLYAEVIKESERGPYPRSTELFLSSAEGVRRLGTGERSAYD